MGKLDGRVAIVTGAARARGQGEAIARLFIAEGARVMVTDVAEDEGEATARSLGEAAAFHALDVRDEAAWAMVVADAERRWGSVDILVNNAGTYHSGTIVEHEKADFMRVLEINLVGAWLGMKAVVPGMIGRGRGAIVNTSSAMGLVGMNGIAAYASSKWALRGLSRTAAMELASKGIRVNSIYPGGINTPMANPTNEPADVVSQAFRSQAMPRVGESQEIAHAVLFLVSDDASYICGAELAVDGGLAMGPLSPMFPGAHSWTYE